MAIQHGASPVIISTLRLLGCAFAQSSGRMVVDDRSHFGGQNALLDWLEQDFIDAKRDQILREARLVDTGQHNNCRSRFLPKELRCQRTALKLRRAKICQDDVILTGEDHL